MKARFPKWALISVAALLVVATFVAIIPLMTAGTPAYEVFLNLSPATAGDWVVEVFNWQGAYGKPWEYESVTDAHLGDLVPEWWDNGTKFGAKFWAELDKIVVIYHWNKITGEYKLIGMASTVADPPTQDAHNMDVWEASLCGDGDGSYTAGTFRWLGAKSAQEIVDTLLEWVASGQSMNEDAVKAAVTDLAYFKSRMGKP